MAEIEIRLPKMGESVTEATITNWLKNPGETVSLDEPLVEVATDKVDNELPSEAEGVLIKQLFEKDQVAQVGDVIAIISTDGDSPTINIDQGSETLPTTKVDTTIKEEVSQPNMEISISSNENGNIKISKNGSNGKYYSPLVRSIAEKEGINQETLDSVEGSGLDGRVTKKDILAFIGGESPKTNPSGESLLKLKKAL